jgi:hypothetical protein
MDIHNPPRKIVLESEGKELAIVENREAVTAASREMTA